MKTKISIIAAIGKNRELGKDNKLLWHIPKDMKRFKKLTQNHAVIMGRKTYESIGKPLPNRINIVVTKDLQTFIECIHKSEIRISKSETNSNFQNSNGQNGFELRNSCFEFNKNFIVCSSLETAIEKAKRVERDEIFIIGGGEIYSQALPYTDKLYLTIVDETADADTFFPDYSLFKKVVYKKERESGGYRFIFIELER